MALDEATVEKLKAQHEEVMVLRHKAYEVVVRGPTRPEMKRFRSMAVDDRRRADALETLLRNCVVYPDGKAFEEMLDKKPGLVETFGDAVMELAGSGRDVEKKEL